MLINRTPKYLHMPLPPRYRTTMNINRIIDFGSAGAQYTGYMDIFINFLPRVFDVNGVSSIFKAWNDSEMANQHTESQYTTGSTTSAALAGFQQIMPLPAIESATLPWYNAVRVIRSSIQIEIVSTGAANGEVPSAESQGLFIATQPYLLTLSEGAASSTYDLQAIRYVDDARQDPFARMTGSGLSNSSNLRTHRNSISMKKLMGVRASAIENDISGASYTRIGTNSGGAYQYLIPDEYLALWRVVWASTLPANALTAYVTFTLGFKLTYDVEFFNATTNLLSNAPAPP